MKKILILPLILALVACSGTIRPMKPGATPKEGNAVFIGRVDLTPAINDDWAAAAATDTDMMKLGLSTTPGTGENVKDFNDDTDVTYDGMRTNGFFAIEVKPGGQLAIRSLNFHTHHKPYWLSNTDYDYYTTLSNPSFSVGMPGANNVYYIGTIKIGVKDKSFAAKDDGTPNRDKLLFIMPSSMDVTNDCDAAKQWFGQNFANITTGVQCAPATMKDSGNDNVFNKQTTVTTVQRY